MNRRGKKKRWQNVFQEKKNLLTWSQNYLIVIEVAQEKRLMRKQTQQKTQKLLFPSQKQSEQLLAALCKSEYMFVLYKKHRAFHISTSVFVFYVMNHCFSAKKTSAEATFVRSAEAQLPPIQRAVLVGFRVVCHR